MASRLAGVLIWVVLFAFMFGLLDLVLNWRSFEGPLLTMSNVSHDRFLHALPDGLNPVLGGPNAVIGGREGWWHRPMSERTVKALELKAQWWEQCEPIVKQHLESPPEGLKDCEVESIGENAWALHYLCTSPELYSEKTIMLDFGLGRDIGFDRHLAKLIPNLKVYGFDPTPHSYDYIMELARGGNLPQWFRYHRIGADGHDGKFYFLNGKGQFLPGPVMTLSSIMEMLDLCWVDVIKIDVEGSEIDFIEQQLDNYQFIPSNHLCLEFHSFTITDNEELKRSADTAIRNLVERLEQNGFRLAKIIEQRSEQAPKGELEVIETTFVRLPFNTTNLNVQK